MAVLIAVANMARNIFEDSSDEEEMVIEKIVNFAELTVPNMNHQQFKFNFRLSEETFEDLFMKYGTVLINNEIDIRRSRTNIRKELLILIWYLANMECIRSVAERFGVTKSTCWKSIYRTAKLVLLVNNEYKIIHWPTVAEQNITANFFNSHGFTGIIGCIDGTHIKITAPKFNKNSYVNRKGYHSILLQGVCDHRKLFIDVYAGEAGSLHDYSLYRRSPLYGNIQNENIVFGENYLIGDLAYKLNEHLIVGFKDNGHLTDNEKRFNNILSRKRVLIEHTFGLLKGRFRRLKFLETVRMDLIALLTVTSCILHNTCIRNGDIPDVVNLQEEIQEELINRPHNNVDVMDEEDNQNAIAKRYNIVNGLEMHE